MASILGLAVLGCEGIVWAPTVPLVLPGLAILRQYGIGDPIVRVRGGRRGLFWVDCGTGVASEWASRGLSVIEALPDWLSRLFREAGSSCRVYHLPHVRVVGVASLFGLTDGVGDARGFSINVSGCLSRIVVASAAKGVIEPFVATYDGAAALVYPHSGGVLVVGVSEVVDLLLPLVGEPSTDIRVGYGSCDEPCRVSVGEDGAECMNCPSLIVPAASSLGRSEFNHIVAGPWWLLG